MLCASCQGFDFRSMAIDVGNLFSGEEENDQEKKSADFKSAISNTPESFRPSLSLQLGQVWKDVGSKRGNTQINRDDGETDCRLFLKAAMGVCFEVKGNPEFLAPYDEGMVTLGICAKAAIKFQQAMK